ncbi:MAG: hypothetical protein ACFB51_10210 [Anaerolineae bacterium]
MQAFSTLRPLTIGQLIDRSLRIYRRNFWTFIGVVAVVQIPISALRLVAQLGILQSGSTLFDPLADPTQFQLGPGYFFSLLGLLAAGILSFIFVQGIATAALARTASDNYFGDQLDIIDAFEAIGTDWPRVVAAILVLSILNLILAFLAIIPCAGWLVGPGLLFFLAAAVTQFVPPVVVLEGKNAIEAIRRAWDLARRRFWWLLAYVVILLVFTQIVVQGPATVVSFGASFVLEASAPDLDFLMVQTIQTIVSYVVQSIALILALPLQVIAVVMAYFDIRIRTEGFDLTVSAAGPEAEADIVAEAPPAETGQIITWSEVGYFSLITVGVITIFGGLYLLLIGVILALFAAVGA